MIIWYLFASFSMFGLIWTIQLVHYPSFSYINKDLSLIFQHFHQRRISYIVAPLMLIEIFLSGYFYFSSNSDFWLIQFCLVCIIWLYTFFISIPSHNKLDKNYSSKSLNFLVKANWLRTTLWSLKSIFILKEYYHVSI
jgi:hypothetical protein